MKQVLCFIDIETTGLFPHLHTITEIAIVRSDGVHFCAKIALTAEQLEYADPVALEINGYNAKSWVHAMSARAAAKECAKLMKQCKIVGHNVHFDVAFIKEWFAEHGETCMFDPRLVDTQVLSYEHLYFLRSHSLDTIRAFFGWGFEGAHTALVDALDCKRLYEKLCRASAVKRCFWRFKNFVLQLLKSMNKYIDVL